MHGRKNIKLQGKYFENTLYKFYFHYNDMRYFSDLKKLKPQNKVRL